jgi:hypothetical protein
VLGEVLVSLPLGQLTIMVGAILPERGAIWIFRAHSSSPGAHWPSSAWISRIRSPIEARSLNTLAGVDRGGFSTQRGTQVNNAVRNSLHRPPHQRQTPSTKSCSRTSSSTVQETRESQQHRDIASNLLFNG